MSRSDHFLARADEHLARLDTAVARRGFLAGQIEAWQYEYKLFIDTEGASGPPGADATDYLLVILGLGTRYERERLLIEAAA